eukprot:851930-Rhodomonas_salina.4
MFASACYCSEHPCVQGQVLGDESFDRVDLALGPASFRPYHNRNLPREHAHWRRQVGSLGHVIDDDNDEEEEDDDDDDDDDDDGDGDGDDDDGAREMGAQTDPCIALGGEGEEGACWWSSIRALADTAPDIT